MGASSSSSSSNSTDNRTTVNDRRQALEQGAIGLNASGDIAIEAIDPGLVEAARQAFLEASKISQASIEAGNGAVLDGLQAAVELGRSAMSYASDVVSGNTAVLATKTEGTTLGLAKAYTQAVVWVVLGVCVVVISFIFFGRRKP